MAAKPWPVPPVSQFNPDCTFKDPCVNYCCKQHEWFHFNDQRPWNMKWSMAQITLAGERPAYERELNCLKSFR